MSSVLFRGDQGPEVDHLAEALARELGDDAAAYPVLKRPGSPIDEAFDAAIRRWQAGVGVIADGLVGPRGQVLLGLAPAPGERFTQTPLSVSAVVRLFPATKPGAPTALVGTAGDQVRCLLLQPGGPGLVEAQATTDRTRPLQGPLETDQDHLAARRCKP